VSGLELNPVAVGNAVVLRAINAGGWSSRAELAHAVGKDPRNLPRDIGVLAKAGLIADAGGTALTLTDEGRAQLDAIARAEGQTTGGDLLPDERLVVHAQLRPDPDNPRKDFDSDEAQEKLDELRVSIVQDGLLQNLVCRTDPEGIADYIVTAGNRRWHAIQQAIFDADWPEDRPIRIKLREGDAQSSLLTAIVENKQRADMTEIEEAEAFGDLVNVHGMKTIDIAGKTGLSQKVIQNRLKLLRLSDEDKQRMRLPEDHPDHLGYKAALRQLTVTREPEPTLSQQIAEHGTATLATGEPGSPDPSPTPSPAASLGRSLTDVEALILAEVADKAERQPDDLHPGYTAALPQAMKSGVPHLIARGLLGTRQKGMTLLIRPLLHTSGLKQWLEAIGFYDAGRDTVLFELAARVQGAENTADRQSCGIRYATAWLNLEGDPRNEAATSASAPDDIALRTFKPDPSLTQADIDEAYEATERAVRSLHEPEQPELIEATEEEKAARRRAERMAAEAASDEAALATFVGWMRDKLAAKRAEGAHGWRNPEACAVQDIADQLVGHVAKGDPVDIAILAMMLGIKAGAMGAPGHLRTMPTPRMERLMIEARAARYVSAEGPAEPDPVEDFVQEELDDEEADAGGVWTEAARAFDGKRERGGPAVPIRKSITPDFIVCLEDGRKFKSLKRHLRTRYDLSPEEYRAKWGLPSDYPMVAPNYAKARADLARQMGLRDA
jgi:ParB/RepB/Spo0J family partition protein